jgi:hypothetical protein
MTGQLKTPREGLMNIAASFEVACTYTILIIYVSIECWDQKNLKHGHERHNLDRRNLATML